MQLFELGLKYSFLRLKCPSLVVSPLEGQASSLVCPRWQKSNVSPNRSLGKLRRRETGQEKQPNFTFPLFLCQSEDKFGQGLGPCYRNLHKQKISFAMIFIFDISCHSKGQRYICSELLGLPNAYCSSKNLQGDFWPNSSKIHIMLLKGSRTKQKHFVQMAIIWERQRGEVGRVLSQGDL